MRWLVLGDIGRSNLYHVGDEAMAEVAIAELSARGASSITLVATHAGTASRRYGVPAVNRVGVGPRWSTAKRDELLDRAVTGDFDGLPALARLDEEVKQADAVLISGGGNMTTRFSHHIDERAALIRLATRHGKQVVVAAQTIGPALTERERGLVAEMMEASRAFAVRDEHSYRLALELGGDPERVHRISDDAILLSPRQEDLAAAASAVGHNERYVAASFTVDAGNSGLDRHEYLDLIAAVLDDIVRTLDVEVLLIPHIGSLDGPVMVGDELSDASILERVTSDRIRALAPMTARVTMAVTAGAMVSVSTRYHPLIFATAHSTPALGISLSRYSTIRMQGALEPLGLGRWVVGPASIEGVPTAVRDVTEDGPAAKAWLEPLMRARREHQQAWWDSAVAMSTEPVPPAPVAPRDLPTRGAWAKPAAQALELFVELEKERERTADLHQELESAHREGRELGARLAAAQRQVTTVTKRAARAEERRAVRLADKVGTGVRAIRGRRPGREIVESAAPAPRPMLSVLIPIYNVEPYLHECLESVVLQSLKDMEIILVDDGSTDSSPVIAQEFAHRDSRIRYITQSNRGLGAVRNRGVALAQGRYLTFVDSDDVVPRSAFAALVDALERSGSDVALGGPVIIDADGSRHTWQWVRDQHNRDYSTTLAESPQLLRNFYTWSKVYRSGFWRHHGFSFREGVLFEDQPVITEMLCRAESIEVIAQTTYLYRIRPDDSALTGRMYTLPDIRTRDEAVQLTYDSLTSLGAPPRIMQAWLWTLAEHHLPRYLKRTVHDAAEYAAVVEMVRGVLTPEILDALDDVSAAHRMLCYLALTEERDTVAEYLQAGGESTSAAALELIDDCTVALLPSPETVANAPAWAGVVSRSEQRLQLVLDGHDWQTPSELNLEVRAGISQALPPTRVDVRVLIVFSNGVEVTLPHDGALVPVAELPRPLGVSAWYVMRVSIDMETLHREHPEALARGARIEVDVSWDEFKHRSVLGRRGSARAARHVTGSVLPGGMRTVQLGWARPSGLHLRTFARAVVAETRPVGPGCLRLLLQSHAADFDIVYLDAKVKGTPARRHLVRRTERTRYEALVDLNWLKPDERVHFVAINEHGMRRNVHGPAESAEAATGQVLTMSTTPGARLEIIRSSEERPCSL